MLQNTIYGTCGDSSQTFKTTLHERVPIDTTDVLVNGVPELNGDVYSPQSNVDTIERDLSMYNIDVVQPWKNAASDNDIVPMLKAQIDTLPLFDGCCLESTESPYYVEGDWIKAYDCLPYRFNKYGIDVVFAAFKTYSSYQYMYENIGYAASDRMYCSPFIIKDLDSTLSHWREAIPTLMYLAKSSTTNGFWYVYPSAPDHFTFKVYLTLCIDEDSGALGYRPVFASPGNAYYEMPEICRTYAINGHAVDMNDWSIAKAGYSGAYILRQVRILNYLFPDLYIISGGLSKMDQDIIHIDNNTYIHLLNDMYIKIK